MGGLNIYFFYTNFMIPEINVKSFARCSLSEYQDQGKDQINLIQEFCARCTLSEYQDRPQTGA